MLLTQFFLSHSPFFFLYFETSLWTILNSNSAKWEIVQFFTPVLRFRYITMMSFPPNSTQLDFLCFTKTYISFVASKWGCPKEFKVNQPQSKDVHFSVIFVSKLRKNWQLLHRKTFSNHREGLTYYSHLFWSHVQLCSSVYCSFAQTFIDGDQTKVPDLHFLIQTKQDVLRLMIE